ncbi:hypothetical protein ACLOJK_016547 [Asimina triloba]
MYSLLKSVLLGKLKPCSLEWKISVWDCISQESANDSNTFPRIQAELLGEGPEPERWAHRFRPARWPTILGKQKGNRGKLRKTKIPLQNSSEKSNHRGSTKAQEEKRGEKKMWHEARRSERKVHDMMDAARRRAQRRAIFLAKRRGDPQQSLQVIGSRSRTYRDDGLYQATQDQQGLFDGRALLDFIRDSDSRTFRAQHKTDEEEELEEFVNFERYRDLIKHRRRGFTDEEGLKHVNEEMEAKIIAPFVSDSYITKALLPLAPQPSASKGAYSQVGFSYGGDGKEDSHLLESDDDDDGDDDEDDEEEKDISSDDSNDEGMETIAKEFGVKRYNWLLYMDKKAKEEEKRQKEVVKGDPAIRKLSRKERRKASQMEREREREAARSLGEALLMKLIPDPECKQDAYLSRSRSPSYSRRYDRTSHADNGHRSKPKAGKIEYITEYGGSSGLDDQKLEGISPPSSPFQPDTPNRPSGDHILEALHVDPASAVSLDKEKNRKVLKPLVSTSSAIAKLSKPTAAAGGAVKPQQGEKKETPQERLKRIMSKQLNKQIKKDTAAEMAKKREQERQRMEKLAETSRMNRYRHRETLAFHGNKPKQKPEPSKIPFTFKVKQKPEQDPYEIPLPFPLTLPITQMNGLLHKRMPKQRCHVHVAVLGDGADMRAVSALTLSHEDPSATSPGTWPVEFIQKLIKDGMVVLNNLIGTKLNDVRGMEPDRNIWRYSVPPSFIAAREKYEDSFAIFNLI